METVGKGERDEEEEDGTGREEIGNDAERGAMAGGGRGGGGRVLATIE